MARRKLKQLWVKLPSRETLEFGDIFRTAQMPEDDFLVVTTGSGYKGLRASSHGWIAYRPYSRRQQAVDVKAGNSIKAITLQIRRARSV